MTDTGAACQILDRLQACELVLDADRRAWLAVFTSLAARDPAAFWSVLNSKSVWGGAESLANQALNPNSGYDPVQWHFQVRAFRDAMIELGELLRARGDHYPDIDAWLLAFNNWNRANV